MDKVIIKSECFVEALLWPEVPAREVSREENTNEEFSNFKRLNDQHDGFNLHPLMEDSHESKVFPQVDSIIDISTDMKEDPWFINTDEFGEEMVRTKIKGEKYSNFIEMEENCEELFNYGSLDHNLSNGSESLSSSSSSSLLKDKGEDILTHKNSQDKNQLMQDSEEIEGKRKSLQCTLCDKQFKTNYKLRRHMDVHEGIKSHHCTQCDKQFFQKCNLNRHMFMHAQRKSHHCIQCDKQFSNKFNLIRHMVSHTGMKSHHCIQCDKLFSRKFDLVRHMIVHTEMKPHRCARCEKQFSLKIDLSRHMDFHTKMKQHRCVQCDKQFSRKFDLKRHLGVHTEKK